MPNRPAWITCRVLLVAVLVALLGLGLAGCSEDDEIPVAMPECEDPDGLRFPPTADQVMANFRLVYELMDADAWQAVMAPSLVTHLQQVTQNEFPAVGPTLDHAEETVIATRMFSGEAFTNSRGNLVPGVSAISFDIFEQKGAWAVSPDTDPIPDTLAAPFDVRIILDRLGQSSFLVEGRIRFYVAPHDTVVCGEERTYFRVVGQVDLTSGWGKGSIEAVPWGSVKGLFW